MLISVLLFQGYLNAKGSDEKKTVAISQAEINKIQDPEAKKIVQSIAEKLAKIKGYTATIERQERDVNGGVNKYQEEHTVLCPDKFIIDRLILNAHNYDRIGENVIIAANEKWILSKNHEDSSKETVSEMEKVSKMPRRDLIALHGYMILTDPFAPYKMESVKKITETDKAWILGVEYKTQFKPWMDGLTIDKETGMLKKVEAILPQYGATIVFLDIKKLSLATDKIPESMFKIENLEKLQIRPKVNIRKSR